MRFAAAAAPGPIIRGEARRACRSGFAGDLNRPSRQGEPAVCHRIGLSVPPSGVADRRNSRATSKGFADFYRTCSGRTRRGWFGRKAPRWSLGGRTPSTSDGENLFRRV